MIDVTLIPILPDNDNYAYILEGDNGQIAVVDPGDAAPIIDALKARDIKPDIILITHHHWDHVDGLPEMLAWHDCPVMGAAHPRGTPKVKFTEELAQGDTFEFGGERVEILGTPGHCREHICFYFEKSGFVLSGDALFAMGCGRIIDGTPLELYETLQKLSALPDKTQVFCGHEYTLTNAEFCAYSAPNDPNIIARLDTVKHLRANNRPTIPTTIGLEKQTNVFLQAKSAAEFATLRHAKDNF